MTIPEIEEMLDDTKRMPRATDKVALSTALGVLEIARQLMFLNQHLTAQAGGATPQAQAAKK